jgi:hypothetical protein
MVVVRVPEDESAYLVLDDQGRPIGRVVHTEYALDRSPPDDTVFMER